MISLEYNVKAVEAKEFKKSDSVNDLIIVFFFLFGQIDRKSTAEDVLFKSNFFGSFTADIFVAPNSINFETVFDKFLRDIHRNFVVLATISALTGLYLILLIIVRRMDVKDAQLVSESSDIKAEGY